MRWTVGNIGWTTKNDNANNGVLKWMEEILRRTPEILKWPGGVQAEGAVGGDKGNVQADGGILEADKGMWGETGSVWADKGCCSRWGRGDFSI